eukprot:143904_1
MTTYSRIRAIESVECVELCIMIWFLPDDIHGRENHSNSSCDYSYHFTCKSLILDGADDGGIDGDSVNTVAVVYWLVFVFEIAFGSLSLWSIDVDYSFHKMIV